MASAITILKRKRRRRKTKTSARPFFLRLAGESSIASLEVPGVASPRGYLE